VTLLGVLVSDNAPPLQVLAGACEPNIRPAGTVTVIPDCVKAKGLVLVNDTTSMVEAFAATLAGENATPTCGANGVTIMGAMQAEAALPPTAGAVVVALLALKVTIAVSLLPDESVTTRVKVPAPVVMTLTAALVAPETMWIAGVLLQAYDAIVALQAGALPPASKVPLPDVNPGGIFTAAIGLSAALTALNAFAIPAPHVVVVQAHSTLDVDPLTHCGVTGVVTGCG
jgi:hypothetical protein